MPGRCAVARRHEFDWLWMPGEVSYDSATTIGPNRGQIQTRHPPEFVGKSVEIAEIHEVIARLTANRAIKWKRLRAAELSTPEHVGSSVLGSLDPRELVCLHSTGSAATQVVRQYPKALALAGPLDYFARRFASQFDAVYAPLPRDDNRAGSMEEQAQSLAALLRGGGILFARIHAVKTADEGWAKRRCAFARANLRLENRLLLSDGAAVTLWSRVQPK